LKPNDLDSIPGGGTPQLTPSAGREKDALGVRGEVRETSLYLA